MSIKFKLFSILGLSQLLLVSVLIVSFIVLIERVKNEPQDLRAFEQALQFEKELKFKEETYKNFIFDLKLNPEYKKLILDGFNNRNSLVQKIDFFKNLMNKNSLSIFELINKNGKVQFRFHRPNDFGDDKSQQKLIQKALSGEIATILESGHSGLGFRMAVPFYDNIILIGQKVDSEFLSQISANEGTDIAIFEKGNLISSSNNIIEEYSRRFSNFNLIPEKKRVNIDNKYYYTVKLPYTKKGLTDLDLEFLILIDETSLNATTNKIWFYFSVFVFIIFTMIFFVSFLFSKDIVKAVRSLNYAMSNIGEDEKKILNLKRKDEIGTMSKSFVHMKEDLLSYQHNLEAKIDLKTSELQNSLKKVNELRLQQDGDYFLTSLLINPLMKKNLNNDLIQVSSIIKQKKQFDFKGKHVEIGGDLCITDKIHLRGIEYTIFLNGDAMGKSLQGAGGALVMGTVFKAILQNTADVLEIQEKYPEIWLKDCYEEIQKVFISFEGSMLISCIIGLIDSKQGSLYYFNAEHPFLILHRDNVASFIDKELTIHKIGLDIQEHDFKIHCFQLQSGDSIFLGSDGKDEIILNELLEGEEASVNTNDSLILEFIQNNNGDLIKIQEEIFTTSKIIDDFTLMKISYDEKLTIHPRRISSKLNNEYAEAVNKYKSGDIALATKILEKLYFDFPDEIKLKKQLSKIYFKNKNYLAAIRISEEYLRYVPLDTNILLYTSHAYKQLGKTDKAFEISERIFIREPENKKNLKNLSELLKYHESDFLNFDKINRILELEV